MSWTRFARRSHAPVSARLLQEAQRPSYFTLATGLQTGIENHVWVNDTIYIPTSEQEALKEAARYRLDDGWEYVDGFAGAADLHLTPWLSWLKTSPPGFKSSRGDALSTWFDSYRTAMAFVPVFRTLDRVLAERVSAEEAATYLDEADSGDTAEGRERAELQGLANELRAVGDLSANSLLADQLLTAHTVKYGWLRVRWYLGKPFTVEDFRDRAVALLALPMPAPRMSAKSDYLPASDRSRHLAELAHLRTHRAEVINEAIWKVIPRLQELAGSLSISYEDLVYLYPQELLDAVRVGSVSAARAKERRVSFVSALVDGNFIDAAGPTEVAELVARLEVGLPDRTAVRQQTGNTLVGVAASGGKARGPVRIVHSADDADQLRAGRS